MIEIQYIGNKKLKRDTVAGTGMVWRPGQVLPVDDKAAVQLLQFPSIWAEPVAEEEVSENQGDLLAPEPEPEPEPEPGPGPEPEPEPDQKTEPEQKPAAKKAPAKAKPTKQAEG